MGFFSAGTKVSVASTVYNLAGDAATRPNYLKTAMVGSLLSTSNTSLADQLIQNYANGPGIQLKNFARWSVSSGYQSLIGMTASTKGFIPTADSVVLQAQVQAILFPGSTTNIVAIQNASVGAFDYSYWVEQYILTYHPSRITDAYTMAIDGSGVVTITYSDSTTDTFTISSYSSTSIYLYIAYYTVNAGGVINAGSTNVFIYKEGTGNSALDTECGTFTTSGTFFPYIPVRINGTFISNTYQPDIYTQSKAAYKKALGNNADFDQLVSQISVNANLGHINYAYILFGVSMNVTDNACRAYIYQFFLTMLEDFPDIGSSYTAWESAYTAAATSQTTYNTWNAAQSNPLDPLYGTPAPIVIPYPSAPAARIQINSGSLSAMNFNYIIDWKSIIQTTGTGILGGHNPGDYWFEAISDGGADSNVITLNYQVTSTLWETLTIVGLTSLNYIYGTNAVIIDGAAALAATTESGFIIPLQSELFNSLRLVDITQMATACCFVMFNSYTVTTEPWYTAGWFTAVIFVAAIAVTVSTGGAGAGLLGSAAVIGGDLGFTGLTAVIVGAVANAVAAIVLVQIVQMGATSIFGQKIGAIIGAIAAILALDVGTALSNGQTLASAFVSMMRVDNLIRLTNAVGNGVSQYMQSNVQDILNKTNELISSYDAQMKAVEDQTTSTLGFSGASENPLTFIDVTSPVKTALQQGQITVPSETPSTYLSRTLMSGSDICDLSNGMITNFTDITLTTNLLTA